MSTKEEERAESTGTSGSGEDIDLTDPTTPKVCVVCNDRALSCNFGAITCESCKAFFRRNAAKDWTSKCDGTCQITVETRSYCKKCRLTKCFEVGMNKGLILTDEQKRLRKQKIIENKVRRGNVGGSGFDSVMPDVHFGSQENLSLGFPPVGGGGLPHTGPLPVLRCLPYPHQRLTNLHTAFPSYHSEKMGFEKSTVNTITSQTTLPNQISPRENTIALPTDETRPLRVTPDTLNDTADNGVFSKVDQAAIDNDFTDPAQPGNHKDEVSEVSSQMDSTTTASRDPYYVAVSEGQNTVFRNEYSPDSKKHRASSSDLTTKSFEVDSSSLNTVLSSQSDAISDSILQQTGIVCTTLKILMDSESYKSGLQDLIAPIVVPNYRECFNHPSLLGGDVEFLRHIQQLEHAMTCAFTEAKKQNKCPKDPNYTQIFNFSEASIKCLVKMAKNLGPFLKLDTDDQILLLKNSILEMMVLGSAASYDPQEKGWHIKDGNEVRLVSTKVVKSSRDGLILMGHYEMIILCVLSATKRDLGLLALLTVLSLFSTQTQRVPLELHNKAKVDLGYQLYWDVLQRYVFLKYCSEEQVMVQNLAKASDIVRDFSETYIQSILKLPFDKINPLLLEIFDVPYT